VWSSCDRSSSRCLAPVDRVGDNASARIEPDLRFRWRSHSPLHEKPARSSEHSISKAYESGSVLAGIESVGALQAASINVRAPIA